jgi:hypothetical protein
VGATEVGISRVLLIIFGIYLWWKIGYKWLFLGAVFATGFFLQCHSASLLASSLMWVSPSSASCY